MSGFAGHPRLEVKKGQLSRIWIGVVVLMMFVTWSYCLKEMMAFINTSQIAISEIAVQGMVHTNTRSFFRPCMWLLTFVHSFPCQATFVVGMNHVGVA